MSVRAQRRIMNLMSVGFLSAAVGAAFYGMQTPLVDASRTPVLFVANGQVDAESSGESNAIDRLLATTKTPLQRPLYDPPKPRPVIPKVVRPQPPKPKVAAPPVVPKVELQLLGTIIEDNIAVAIVADATGAIDQKRIGGTLDLQPPGVVVERIQSGEVVVSHHGTRLTLMVATTSNSDKASVKGRSRNKQRRKTR